MTAPVTLARVVRPPPGVAVVALDGPGGSVVRIARRSRPWLTGGIAGAAVVGVVAGAPLWAAVKLLGFGLLWRRLLSGGPVDLGEDGILLGDQVVRFADLARCEVVGVLNSEVRVHRKDGARVLVFSGPHRQARYVAAVLAEAIEAGRRTVAPEPTLPAARLVRG